MLIVDTEVSGLAVDVRIIGEFIEEIQPQLAPQPGEKVIEASGGALLPGLHDHHIHLYAQAAADASIPCGPPHIESREQLAAGLQQPGSGWLRGVGYHESVAGSLDRWQLDAWVSERPLRIQHRSGKMWFLNSCATELLGLDARRELAGIDRDSRGRATGRLFRMDPWLRDQLARQSAVDLAPLSRQLAAWGVTGVTDASASNSAADMDHFCRLVARGELLQGLTLMGDATLPPASHPRVRRGALKILLDDHRLPEYEQLVQMIEEGHLQQRGVAIHCVTRTELVFALTALLELKGPAGDRIEHASVAPDDTLALLQQAGVTVVTQPGFIYLRGDQYRVDVPAAEHDFLYRCQSLLDAGIPLAGSSDAPYGSPDPWLAMRAAVQRRSRSGRCLGAAEKLQPEQALQLFTGTAAQPGGGPRAVAPGAVADLCLLDRPWRQARTRLDGDDVLATLNRGEIIYRRDQARLAT